MADFKSKCEKLADEATKNCAAFKNIDLRLIKDKVTIILNFIGSNGMFDEYTKHDISHVDGVLKLIDKIVTEGTCKVMTPADWLLIVLSVYFHDLGMFIPKKEYENRMSNQSYVTYKKEISGKLGDRWEKLPDDEKERYIYQNYVRSNHGNRIRQWMTEPDSISDQGFSKVLKDMLNGLSADLIECVAKVCNSHNLDNLKSSDWEVDHAFGSDDSEKANTLFSAILLRTADLLHVTSDRTPSAEFNIIDIQDPISKSEWNKQKAVRNIDVKKTNSEGKTPSDFKPSEFEVQATFTDPDAYFAFDEYLTYADNEIRKCNRLCSEINRERNLHYDYPWKGISKERIETKGFETSKLSFQIDRDRILKLLMGHTLYNDSTVVIRELVQNGIDACRLFSYGTKEGSSYNPLVRVTWLPKEQNLIVQDNGTGMSKETIFDHLLMVGSSRYQDAEFKKQYPNFHSISRFGIGLLTCFMISDNVDIYTKENGKQTKCLLIRNLHGNFIMRETKDNSQILDNAHGSTFKLHVRKSTKPFDFETIIRRWIVLPEVKVEMVYDGNKSEVGYESGEAAINAYLDVIGIDKDKKNFKVGTKSEGGITVSCLMKKDYYTGIWQFANLQDIGTIKDFPAGICIEGIRVTNQTPGYNGLQYLSIVNCKGNSAPNTNVSRTSIEKDAKLDCLLNNIYKAYLNMLGDQFETLGNSNSLSWESEEAMYLISNLYDEDFRRANLSNQHIFIECVKNFPLFIVENETIRVMKSINSMPQQLHTIENRGFNSACDILTEVKDQYKTALNIMKVINPDYNTEIGDILDYNAKFPFINHLLYHNYEIKELKAIPDTRTIQIGWEKGNGNWIINNISRPRNQNQFRKFLIPLNKDSFSFTNESKYMAVNSVFGCILLPDNYLWEWLISHYKVETKDNKPFDAILLYISSVLSSTRYRGEEGLKRFFISEYDFKDIQKDLNLEEVAKHLPDNYEVFRIDEYYKHFDGQRDFDIFY